jgi:hypothetical protein
MACAGSLLRTLADNNAATRLADDRQDFMAALMGGD